MKPVAVILSGCGVFDGAEVREAVFTLLALDRLGVPFQCLAPDILQRHVVNHLSGEEQDEPRNVLVESARIARGEIKSLATVDPGAFSAALLPGGFGAAKNLCDFAFAGTSLKVEASVASFLQEAHLAGLPLGFACIAPAIAAKLFGAEGVEFTIGNDEGTASALSTWGAKHCERSVTDVVVDQKLKIATTPAYMFGEARLSEVCDGIERWVKAVVGML